MLFFSLILICFLILWIGPYEILIVLETANWMLILLALITHIIAIGLRAIRWGFIINKNRDFKSNFIVKIIGLFAGNLSPLKSAGEPVTALAGNKINDIEISEGLSAALTERFFDLGVIGIFLIAAIFLIPQIRFLSIIGAFITLGMVVFIYAINWRENVSIKIYQKLHPWLKKLPLKKKFIDVLYYKIIYGLKGMVKYTSSFTNFKNMSVLVILSISCWLIESVRLLIIFYAFKLEISLITVIIILLLANFIGVVSALPGGIGSFEISMTGLFVLFRVPGNLAGSIVLIDRFISFWIVNLLGLIFTSFYAHDLLEDIKKYVLDAQSG